MKSTNIKDNFRPMTIILSQMAQLDDLVPLFDAYRVFYKQDSNLKQAKRFLEDRLIKKDSIIYIAYIDDIPVGFTQLYPSFSSVSMSKIYVLNDLYVKSNYRGSRIGQELIQTAKNLCITHNYKGLALQTANNNPAQHLYERLEFNKDSDLHYFWTNNKT